MTIEQRKKELIDWITNLEDESRLALLEEIMQESLSELPEAISSLLELSAQTPDSELIRHTSVRDFLKK